MLIVLVDMTYSNAKRVRVVSDKPYTSEATGEAIGTAAKRMSIHAYKLMMQAMY